MASRAILRRKRYLFNSLNQPACTIRGFSNFEHEKPARSSDVHVVGQLHTAADCRKENYITSLPENVKSAFRLARLFRHNSYSISTLENGIGRAECVSSLGFRRSSHFIRYSSTAAPGQPDFGSGTPRNEQQVSGQKKEASPEECDQAVEGLSTVKAKAKAKQIQESQKSEKSLMMRVWAKLLGIGPALRAVASMSRFGTLLLSVL